MDVARAGGLHSVVCEMACACMVFELQLVYTFDVAFSVCLRIAPVFVLATFGAVGVCFFCDKGSAHHLAAVSEVRGVTGCCCNLPAGRLLAQVSDDPDLIECDVAQQFDVSAPDVSIIDIAIERNFGALRHFN